MRLLNNHKAEILAITDTASPRRASIRSAVLPAIRDRYSEYDCLPARKI